MTEDTPATNGNTSGEGEVKTLWIGDLVRVGENKETHTTSSRITLIFFLDMAQEFATLFFCFSPSHTWRATRVYGCGIIARSAAVFHAL